MKEGTAAIVGVLFFEDEALLFEGVDDPRHGGRTNLLGGGEVAQGDGACEDDDGESGQARSIEAAAFVLSAEFSQQVDGRGVELVGNILRVGRDLVWHGMTRLWYIVSWANNMGGVMNEAKDSVQLNDIGQIALTVRDLARAKSFYQDTLGMKFLFDAGTMAFFQCGAVRLMIGLGEDALPIGGMILYFKVSDIQRVHSVLTEKGVGFLQPPHLVARMPDHELWMAFLKDSEGNTLGLMSEAR